MQDGHLKAEMIKQKRLQIEREVAGLNAQGGRRGEI